MDRVSSLFQDVTVYVRAIFEYAWTTTFWPKKTPGFPGFLQQLAMDQVPTPVFDLPQPVPELVKLQVTEVVPADGVMVTVQAPTAAVPTITMSPVVAVCVSAEICPPIAGNVAPVALVT